MKGRLDRLLQEVELPLLVTNPVNVFYLLGFSSSNAVLLVEAERLRLFTDFRYREAARALEGVEVVELQRNLFAELGTHLPERVAFEAEHLTYASYEALTGAGVDLVPAREVLERVRALKEPGELDAIRAAADITNRCYQQLAEERFVGRPERELAWVMDSLMHDLGASGPAFETIVASGPSGALPHARAGDRVIGAGETVVVDAGAVLNGYCADCTRTFATGELPDDLTRAYDVCLEAQRTSLEAVRPGADGTAVDGVARSLIDAAGYEGLFGHGLGHGVGLEVHELPRLRPDSEDRLAPTHVVTVEPGIYLPGRGGIRIEDLVIVGEDGAEVLTSFTKELVTVR